MTQLCHAVNKSLLVSFWGENSRSKWLSQNILSAFPETAFDHVIMLHDKSIWTSHEGYHKFIWIRAYGQFRLWYLKRFITPYILRAYRYIWVVDDDAQLIFNSLHYECVVERLNIPLSSPVYLSGPRSHPITNLDSNFARKIGRWTDFVETGIVVVGSPLAWECIWHHLSLATGFGWGIDLIWCKTIGVKCLPKEQESRACAILDTFGINHLSSGVTSQVEGQPELAEYQTEEFKLFHTKMTNIAALADNNDIFESCSKDQKHSSAVIVSKS
ncbi:unnamed protein product [Didymodactylos carnosus]|uniref:Uncharacterized protein n=1 Tax=Didymodactylos carnosus TaxID=1234261 RepID=A0A815QGP6_9BILA|nr:unnamed protein product [Didymodactylos carnosus]CAF1462650.1 unnamed protein product [Didymodactylos carnosus]CAF4027233.1 unnamed protein product [Didymodactylos carnosus]CAF4332517.1 unnamed protein product [Didymodactylos carnosus]